MTFIDNDEVEKIGRILAEVRRRFAVLWRAAHEGLKYRKEDAAVLWHLALLSNVIGRDAQQRVF